MKDKGMSTTGIIGIVVLVIIIGVGVYFAMDTEPTDEINVLTYAGPESDILEDEYVEAFEEETGIEVNISKFDEDTMRETMITDFEAGTGDYDVVRVQHWFSDSYINEGWIEPMDDYIDASEEVDLDDYPPGALELFADDAGNQYSIPDTLLSSMMIYRDDIFEEQGWDTPETIDEYMEILEEFDDLEEYEDMDGTWVRGAPVFDTFGAIGGWAWAYGGQFVEDGEATVDTETNLEAMEDWVEMAQEYGPAGQSTLDWVEGGELYAGGDILMQTEVTGFTGYVQDPDLSSVVDQNEFALAPLGPGDERVQWAFSTGLAINADSDSKEEAWEFIEWRNTEAYEIEVEERMRFDMPYQPAYEWEEYQEMVEDWNVEEAVDTLEEAYEYATFEYYPEQNTVEIADEIASQISDAIAGDKTVEEALEDAQEEVEDILA